MSGRWYGWRDWFFRIGTHGPGLSVQPPDHWVSFAERLGGQSAWHTRWFCIKPLQWCRLKREK